MANSLGIACGESHSMAISEEWRYLLMGKHVMGPTGHKIPHGVNINHDIYRPTRLDLSPAFGPNEDSPKFIQACGGAQHSVLHVGNLTASECLWGARFPTLDCKRMHTENEAHYIF